jgi:hypothetical protein
MNWLQVIATLIGIATAPVAALVYMAKRRRIHSRARRLEALLATKTGINDDSLTLHQLANALVLTEPEVIEAAAQSKKVEPWAGQSGQESRFRIKR